MVYKPGELVQLDNDWVVIATHDRYAKPEDMRFSGVLVSPRGEDSIYYAERTWLKQGSKLFVGSIVIEQ